jgi:hypothetical protein
MNGESEKISYSEEALVGVLKYSPIFVCHPLKYDPLKYDPTSKSKLGDAMSMYNFLYDDTLLKKCNMWERRTKNGI